MEILSVEEVKKAFAKYGQAISDDEARVIADFLSEMAKIAVDQFLSKNENS